MFVIPKKLMITQLANFWFVPTRHTMPASFPTWCCFQNDWLTSAIRQASARMHQLLFVSVRAVLQAPSQIIPQVFRRAKRASTTLQIFGTSPSTLTMKAKACRKPCWTKPNGAPGLGRYLQFACTRGKEPN